MLYTYNRRLKQLVWAYINLTCNSTKNLSRLDEYSVYFASNLGLFGTVFGLRYFIAWLQDLSSWGLVTINSKCLIRLIIIKNDVYQEFPFPKENEKNEFLLPLYLQVG